MLQIVANLMYYSRVIFSSTIHPKLLSHSRLFGKLPSLARCLESSLANVSTLMYIAVAWAKYSGRRPTYRVVQKVIPHFKFAIASVNMQRFWPYVHCSNKKIMSHKVRLRLSPHLTWIL